MNKMSGFEIRIILQVVYRTLHRAGAKYLIRSKSNQIRPNEYKYLQVYYS